MNTDGTLIFALVNSILFLIIYGALTVIQLLEVRKPNTYAVPWLPKARRTIFFIFLLSFMTLVPTTLYRVCLLFDIPASGLLDISRVAAVINGYCSIALIIKLYFDAYKSRKQK